jgi:hypothetical protein
MITQIESNLWVGCRNGHGRKKRKKMKEKKGKEVGQLEAFGPNRLGSFSIFKMFYN